MGITLDDIQDHIPRYLTVDAKDGIVRALKEDFPYKINYYTGLHQNELLQGDGWNRLDIINLETAQKRDIKGIILSNSCDVSSKNQRDLPSRIVFAPIIPVVDYERCLAVSGVSHDKINAKITAIKEQRVTSLFYLPQGGWLESDYCAVLDDLHSLPANRFYGNVEKTKQFTLSQVGFYLFLFKLSIHFCRFHENVLRDDVCRACSGN